MHLIQRCKVHSSRRLLAKLDLSAIGHLETRHKVNLLLHVLHRPSVFVGEVSSEHPSQLVANLLRLDLLLLFLLPLGGRDLLDKRVRFLLQTL